MKKSTLKSTLTSIVSIVMITTLTGCASVIKPGYKGMMWKPWGKGLRIDTIYDDGLVWKLPWNKVIKYNVQWESYQIKVPLLTADELHVTVAVSAILRPDPDDLPPLELEIGRKFYDNIVKPSFFTITRSVFANYTHKEMTVKGPQIEKEILAGLEEQVKGKHLQFDNVTLDHIMYSPLVTEAVDRKLATKQEIEQKDFEIKIAEKDAEIQRILARGQKDAQQIIDSGLTKIYLQYKSLEVQDKLSGSDNAKFYFIPIGKDGLPVIIDAGEK